MATLLIHRDDHVGGEVDDLLEVLRRHVEQVAEAAGHTLEVPDVRDRRGELDVTHALATHGGLGDLHAAALAHDALEAHALVLAARALPVTARAEDLLSEEAVLLGLERAVVDGLGLLHLAVRPTTDVVSGGQADLDFVKRVNVEHLFFFLRKILQLGGIATEGATSSDLADGRGLEPRGDVDAEFLRRAEHLVVGVTQVDGRTIGRENLDVQAQRLHLLDEHLEGLGDARLLGCSRP